MEELTLPESFAILKEIHFSYGHRLLRHPGKCARLHGHNGRIVAEVSSRKLNQQNMVMDFYDLRKTLEDWVDNTLDHQMILWKKDPLVKVLEKAREPILVFKENPTAEALAKFIFEAAKKKKIPITKIILWETPGSAAQYSR